MIERAPTGERDSFFDGNAFDPILEDPEAPRVRGLLTSRCRVLVSARNLEQLLPIEDSKKRDVLVAAALDLMTDSRLIDAPGETLRRALEQKRAGRPKARLLHPEDRR